MLQVHPAARAARNLRLALRYPVNSVVDKGIKLKHPRGVSGWEVVRRRQETQRLRDAEKATLAVLQQPSVSTPSASRDWLVVAGPDERMNKFPIAFIHRIKSTVSKEFGISLFEMDSCCRTPNLVIPRHAAIYLCKVLTSKSYPDIARRFGDRDHTTAISAVRKNEKRMRADAYLCQVIAELQMKLEYGLMRWRNFGNEIFSASIASPASGMAPL